MGGEVLTEDDDSEHDGHDRVDVGVGGDRGQRQARQRVSVGGEGKQRPGPDQVEQGEPATARHPRPVHVSVLPPDCCGDQQEDTADDHLQRRRHQDTPGQRQAMGQHRPQSPGARGDRARARPRSGVANLSRLRSARQRRAVRSRAHPPPSSSAGRGRSARRTGPSTAARWPRAPRRTRRPGSARRCSARHCRSPGGVARREPSRATVVARACRWPSTALRRCAPRSGRAADPRSGSAVLPSSAGAGHGRRSGSPGRSIPTRRRRRPERPRRAESVARAGPGFAAMTRCSPDQVGTGSGTNAM